jgi:hypothetical protein
MTKPAARTVQLAVMTTPGSSLGDALALARRQRNSFLSAIRRTLAPAFGSPRPMAG